MLTDQTRISIAKSETPHVPGYLAQVHHTEDYAKCRDTDVHKLTFRCGPHHELITSGGWKTRQRHNGTTETIPPPHLNHAQPRTNSFHHPENLLRETEDDADDGP